MQSDINDSQLDSDGDGTTNYFEFIAGTDPRDPNSKVAVKRFEVHPDASSKVIELDVLSGETYLLQAADGSLSEGAWETIDQVTADSNSVSFVLPAADSPSRFYRIVIQR